MGMVNCDNNNILNITKLTKFHNEYIKSINILENSNFILMNKNKINIKLEKDQKITIDLKSCEIRLIDDNNFSKFKIQPSYPINNNFKVYRNNSIYSSNWSVLSSTFKKNTPLKNISKIVFQNNIENNPRTYNL